MVFNLGLEGKVPDHSSFSDNRHGRFRESDPFRRLFEAVLQRCVTEGLVGGEGFAVDASVVRADANRQRRHEDDDDWGGGRAVREYLLALDEDSSQAGNSDRKVSAPGGPAFYGYSTNYLVDTDHGIIVDVEPTTAHRSRELESTKTMIGRVEERFGITPQRLIGDTAYGTASLFNWMVEKKRIEPHTPVWNKAQRKDGSFARTDFIWQGETDRYICPAGRSHHRYRCRFTKPRFGVQKDNTIRYRATKHDCDGCAYKPRCCPTTPQRTIRRSVYESSRDVARAIAQTDAYKQSRKDRKKIEMLFAHLKRILKLDRLRLRGMSGARDEFLLAATAQNLRRIAKLLSRPPPIQGLTATT